MGPVSKLHANEEGINASEDMSIEITQTETKRNKVGEETHKRVSRAMELYQSNVFENRVLE